MDTGTLVDRVYRTLREQILAGVFKPGEKLNLVQLARDLRVSNTPIREAIVRLERVGLVEVVPYCGTKIKRLNPEQLQDIYDVRIVLEELAVRLIIQHEDPDALVGMAEALERQECACNAGNLQAVIEADRAFHDALIQASGNSVLLEMQPTLSDRTRLLLELNTPLSGGIDKAAAWRGLRGHRRIFEAIQEGDREAAAEALRRELTRGKEQLIKQMKKREAL